jgi:uncharacterized membrane protein YbhN (UPF0104 family)
MLVAKLAVTAGLIWWLLSAVDLPMASSRIAKAHVGWLLVAVFLSFVQIWILVTRWCVLVRTNIHPFSYREAFHNLLTGLFFNQALPSGIGGDAMRVWLLTRGRPGRTSDAVSLIFSDRAIGLIGLILIVTIVSPLLVFGPQSRHLDGGSGVAVSLAILAAAVVAGYAFLLGVRRLPALGIPGWSWIMNMYGVVRRVMIGWPVAGQLMALAMVAHLTILFAIAAVAAALGIAVPLTAILVLTPPALILATLPISIAGWGLREAGFVAVLGLVGVSSTDATLLGLSMGMLQLLQGVAGGVVWALGKRQGAR